MPLHSYLGEQSLNVNLGEDQPGGGLYLIADSDFNLFGILQEYDGSAQVNYGFFITGDTGLVEPRYYINEDRPFYVASYDQDAFLISPVDEDAAGFVPFVIRAESTPSYGGDTTGYPPGYLFTGGALLQFDRNEQVPAGRDTETAIVGGSVRVYEAPDGDGIGIFVDVSDGEGHRIGGVIRVNDDITGDQIAPIVGRHDEAFTVAWTQQQYDGSGAETYHATTFNRTSNLDLAVTQSEFAGASARDAGDFVTDIFYVDTAAGGSFGRDRIENFGANDIFVTTTKIADKNGDGIITFGSDKRLDLSDAQGRPVGEITFAGLRSLEFDGIQSQNGENYYVYSRVGSDADEHYLIV